MGGNGGKQVEDAQHLLPLRETSGFPTKMSQVASGMGNRDDVTSPVPKNHHDCHCPSSHVLCHRLAPQSLEKGDSFDCILYSISFIRRPTEVEGVESEFTPSFV